MKIFDTKISAESLNDILNVIQTGELGFGANVIKFEELFSKYSNKLYNVATNSCSAAAYIVFAYLKQEYGCCDIYTPSIGFTAMVWAAKHHGHNIIFVDIDENMLMDLKHYVKIRESKSSSNKNVIMPILYGGISTIPNQNVFTGDEFIILDAAHTPTPAMHCDVSLFSFHPYKPIAASDGGMISTDILELNSFARSYRNFGRVHNGIDYQIVSDGFKFYMNNLNATIALTQLSNYQENLNQRKIVWDKIQSINWEGYLVPHDTHSSYYVGTLIASDDKTAKKYREKYCEQRLYPPLHLQPYYFNDESETLMYTEDLYSRLVNLPLYNLDAYDVLL